jgi:hypothetical protein
MQALNPELIHIDMTAGARAGAAAARLQANPPIAYNLHDAPAVDRRQCVLAAMVVDHEKENSVELWLDGNLFQDPPREKTKNFSI